jgi:hypothetical protein
MLLMLGGVGTGLFVGGGLLLLLLAAVGSWVSSGTAASGCWLVSPPAACGLVSCWRFGELVESSEEACFFLIFFFSDLLWVMPFVRPPPGPSSLLSLFLLLLWEPSGAALELMLWSLLEEGSTGTTSLHHVEQSPCSYRII